MARNILEKQPSRTTSATRNDPWNSGLRGCVTVTIRRRGRTPGRYFARYTRLSTRASLLSKSICGADDSAPATSHHGKNAEFRVTPYHLRVHVPFQTIQMGFRYPYLDIHGAKSLGTCAHRKWCRRSGGLVGTKSQLRVPHLTRVNLVTRTKTHKHFGAIVVVALAVEFAHFPALGHR